MSTHFLKRAFNIPVNVYYYNTTNSVYSEFFSLNYETSTANSMFIKYSSPNVSKPSGSVNNPPRFK